MCSSLPTSTTTPRSTDEATRLSRNRFLKRAAAAVGLAAVGMTTLGEQAARAAVTFGETVGGAGAWGLRVLYSSTAANASALRGELTATTPGTGAAAVRGINAGTNAKGMGVYGSHAGGGAGVRGFAATGTGVSGVSTTGTAGVFKGGGTYGLTGESTKVNGIGVRGLAANGEDAIGVQGEAPNASGGYGVRGLAAHGVGVSGRGRVGVLGGSDEVAVQGHNPAARTWAQLATATSGVYGEYLSYGNYGELGSRSHGVVGHLPLEEGSGVLGRATGRYGAGVRGYAGGSNGMGVLAQGSSGGYAALYAAAEHARWAGMFWGDVNVSQTLQAATKQFVIDHPLDPEGQYLAHASVESSELLTVYSGNVILDDRGEATGIPARAADGRLSPRALNLLLDQIGRWHDAELSDPTRHVSPLRPHDLRHTFAFHLAKVTAADAYELERRLGHRSQRYIQRYANPPEEVAAAYIEEF